MELGKLGVGINKALRHGPLADQSNYSAAI